MRYREIVIVGLYSLRVRGSVRLPPVTTGRQQNAADGWINGLTLLGRPYFLRALQS